MTKNPINKIWVEDMHIHKRRRLWHKCKCFSAWVLLGLFSFGITWLVIAIVTRAGEWR